jgi:flagellar assembly protein FliH
MSSSPKPAAMLEAASTAHLRALPFPYSEIIAEAAARRIPLDGVAQSGPAGFGSENFDSGSASAEAQQARARELGRQEGQADAAKAFDQNLARERAGIAAALAQLHLDRASYYLKVETEVVQLALSIARKILHREAQIDPLLMVGLVRVALEKIEGATAIVLRINPQQAADWRRHLAMHMEPSHLPQIVEDPALEADQCALETSMGTATMGVEVQLKEIEQGLLDLLGARPREVR